MQFQCKIGKQRQLQMRYLHRVCCLTGPPTKLSIDQDAALTSVVIKEMLTSLECTMQNNKSMESRQFKSRKTNSNYWQHDK